MANLSGLEGTPWHITYLKSDEPGKRRDRRGCKFYLSGNKCSKGGTCYGGRYCDEYEKRENLNTQKIKKLDSNIKEKDIIKGKFVVKFDDDIDQIAHEIGKNISEDAPLVKIVIDTPIDGTFEINGEKGIVIDKNIKIISRYSNNKAQKYIEEKTHKNRYEVIRKVVKEVQNKNIVEYGDIVTLLCIDDNKEFELEIRKSVSFEKKSLVDICRKNRINYEFKYYGKKYKIIKIQKDTIDK